MLHIGMASVPQRARIAHAAIESLLAQTFRDFRLRVVCNGYVGIPSGWPKDSRAEYVLGDNVLGDAAKFDLLREGGSSLLATVDDDLQYPPDYLERLLHWNQVLPGCMVGVHGSTLKPGFTTWETDRRLLHFGAPLGKPHQVHFLGTGTSLLRKDWLLDYDPLPYRNLSDIGVGLHLHRKGISRVAVPRRAHWLREIGRPEAVCFQAENLKRLGVLLRPHLKSLLTSEPAPPEGVVVLSAGGTGVSPQHQKGLDLLRKKLRR